MSAPADICLTEAAHWLAFREWGHDALRYSELEAWEDDDPQADQIFGSRQAARYTSRHGRDFFEAIARSDEPFGRSRILSSRRPLSREVAQQMIAASGLSPADLCLALDAHYGPRRTALAERHAILKRKGFDRIFGWATVRRLTIYGASEGGALTPLAPGAFGEPISIAPASPQLVSERFSAWRSWPRPRVLTDEIRECARRDRVEPEEPMETTVAKAPNTKLLQAWQRQFHDKHGFAPARDDIRPHADRMGWSADETDKLARDLAADDGFVRRGRGRPSSRAKSPTN